MIICIAGDWVNANTLYYYVYGAISGPLNDVNATNIVYLNGV